MPKKLTTTEFIEKAKSIHGDDYDYTLVGYVSSHTKIKIICPLHGEFLQTPNSHLSKNGCPKCANNLKKNTYDFIKECESIHKNKYDYSLVNYVNNRTKVKIICPIHGEFNQNPNLHLSKNGCPKCANNDKLNNETFIEKSNKKHKNKYDYSLVNYVNNRTKVKIICPLHGEFNQTPNNHLRGKGCYKCGKENTINKLKKCLTDFIKNSKLVHSDKYDYKHVIYNNIGTKVKIICPIHGEFEQTPYKHLNGSGCKNCNISKGEKMVSNFLDKKNITYIKEHTFADCVYKNKLRFDFYLPKLNMCIEYDGIQHYKPYFKDFNGKGYELTKKRDEIKNKYCEKNNIKLIRIRYDSDVNQVLENFII